MNKVNKKLWVKFESSTESYGPTRVLVNDCEFVDDLLNRLYDVRLLAIPESIPIILYKFDGAEMKPTDTIKLLGSAGKDGGAPLVVRTKVVARSVENERISGGMFCDCNSMQE